MQFWDASALVPLLVEEPRTVEMRALSREAGATITWWGTRIECSSAIRRKERLQHLSREQVNEGLRSLDQASSGWTEIQPDEGIRTRAMRLLAVHPLIAADALQLAAALQWSDDRGGGGDFISLDERLRDAASREGLICP